MGRAYPNFIGNLILLALALGFLSFPLYLTRDMLWIALDPGVSVVTADELLAGAQVTHPRMILLGACADLDSAATGRWTTKSRHSSSRTHHEETVVTLRHAESGRATSWLIRVPKPGGRGCAPEEIRGVRGSIHRFTLEAAQVAGLSPDADRVLVHRWWTWGEAVGAVLLACWFPWSVVAMLHPFHGRAADAARKIAATSVLLSLAAFVILCIGAGVNELIS